MSLVRRPKAASRDLGKLGVSPMALVPRLPSGASWRIISASTVPKAATQSKRRGALTYSTGACIAFHQN